MTISPALAPIYNTLRREFRHGIDFKSLGVQVLWVDRNGDGILEKRYIAGTSRLSQHVGGNAWDVAPMSMSSGHIGIIDDMVERARDMGAFVLWRGVRNHYPHHAHIEGRPAYSQEELAAFYEDGEDVKVSELVTNIQRGMVNAGYDLGSFGPGGDGVDGDWGPSTDQAWQQMCEDAKNPVVYSHPFVPHTHTTSTGLPNPDIGGTPI